MNKKKWQILLVSVVVLLVVIFGVVKLSPSFTPNAKQEPKVEKSGATVPVATSQIKGLPNVVILATGGTIAGTGSSSTVTTGYKSGNLAVESLIKAVPEMKKVANVSGEQIVNVDSTDMTSKTLLKLAKRINELLASKDVDGIVVTHGTDTLEETAYFLNLVVKSDKPVVLTAAMRPATAMSADGPFNLYNAVSLASDKKSSGKGVLVELNDRIGAARDITKTNTTALDTFKSVENGYLGDIVGGKDYFYNQVDRKHTTETVFSISNIDKLPQVDIIYGYQDSPKYMFDAAVKNGAKGIVVAAPGDGTLSTKYHEAAVSAMKKGVKVVLSSRVGSGTVSLQKGFITSDSLNPQKARILLMLALTKTDDSNKIQQFYNQY